MTIAIGDTIPDVELRPMTRQDALVLAQPRRPREGEGRLVRRAGSLYAHPARTTTSPATSHRADESLEAKGVDTIACISVNDPFVMGAWGRDQEVGERVLMLADGNGEFTRAMGLEADMSGAGLGPRSQRYAAVVEDGVVTALFVEPRTSNM